MKGISEYSFGETVKKYIFLNQTSTDEVSNIIKGPQNHRTSGIDNMKNELMKFIA